jgi:hypothetical protein
MTVRPLQDRIIVQRREESAPRIGEIIIPDSAKEKIIDRTRKLRHLHELIAALDRRVLHVERIGEIEIAREGRALREKALQRIAELEASLDEGPISD